MRKIVASSLVGLLLCVSLGSADLVAPRSALPKERISSFSLRAYTETFKPNEECSVIVSGDGSAILALYVFDRDGNCVFKDDVPTPESSDDLAARWMPTTGGRYSLEVRNAGPAIWRSGEIDITTYKLYIR